MVTLDDEMELLEAYVELMCCRYPELCCEYDIDPELGGAQVPNFILQPIVENAIYHGLEPRKGKGHLRILSRVHNNMLILMIEDDGLAEALLGLSQEDREIFMMHWFLRMTDAQIARYINMPRRTVNTRRHKAYRLLKELMGGEADD